MTWSAWREFPWLAYFGLLLSSVLVIEGVYSHSWLLGFVGLVLWFRFNRKLWFLTHAD